METPWFWLLNQFMSANRLCSSNNNIKSPSLAVVASAQERKNWPAHSEIYSIIFFFSWSVGYDPSHIHARRKMWNNIVLFPSLIFLFSEHARIDSLASVYKQWYKSTVCMFIFKRAISEIAHCWPEMRIISDSFYLFDCWKIDATQVSVPRFSSYTSSPYSYHTSVYVRVCVRAPIYFALHTQIHTNWHQYNLYVNRRSHKKWGIFTWHTCLFYKFPFVLLDTTESKFNFCVLKQKWKISVLILISIEFS